MLFTLLFIYLCIYLFIYLFIFGCVGSFVSVRGLSPVAASGDHSSSWCTGLSLSQPLLLQRTGFRRTGSVIVAHGPSCFAACGILPDQGSNLCPLHWQADSQPLRHQGIPVILIFVPLCVLTYLFFPLSAFRIFSLSLVFSNLTMMFLGVFSFVFLLVGALFIPLGVLCDFYIYGLMSFRFWVIVFSLSFVSRYFLISSLISSVISWLFSNVLFSLHVFVCFTFFSPVIHF